MMLSKKALKILDDYFDLVWMHPEVDPGAHFKVRYKLCLKTDGFCGWKEKDRCMKSRRCKYRESLLYRKNPLIPGGDYARIIIRHRVTTNH